MSADANQPTPSVLSTKTKVISAGLIGLGLIIVQAFIPIGFTKPAAIVSIVSFAIAIPMLASYILTGMYLQDDKLDKSTAAFLMSMVGLGTACIGVVGAFWYISWIAGLLFLISGIIAIAVHEIVS